VRQKVGVNMKNIKKTVFDNIEFAIAFSIVWTFFQGCLVLLGVEDYSMQVLLLGGVVVAIGVAVGLTAVMLLLILFEKVKSKIRFKICLWKFKRTLRAMESAYCDVFFAGTAIGETLDRMAINHGLEREEGETDEELRARIRKAMACSQVLNEKQGEGGGVN